MKNELDKQSRKKVSVIIPTFNRSKLIVRSIQSVLEQEGLFDIEVIIVDDGSTDDTKQMVQELKDQRVNYFYQEHRGACAARNYGLEKAEGDYIAFQDSDDIWHSDKLKKQVEQMNEVNADVVFCAYKYHDEIEKFEARVPESQRGGMIDFERILQGNMVGTCTIIGKKECMKRVKFDSALPRWQDWDYALQLTRIYMVYYMPEILVEVYVQSDSITKNPSLAIDATCILLKKYNRELFINPNNLDGLLSLLQMNKNQMMNIIEKQQSRIAQQEEKIVQQRNRLEKAQAQLKDKAATIDQLNTWVQKEIQNNRDIGNSLREVLNSRAWKVGRLITYVPRRIHSRFLVKRGK